MAFARKSDAAMGTLLEKFGASEQRLDLRGRLIAALQDTPNLRIEPETWSSPSFQGRIEFMTSSRKTLDDAIKDIASRLGSTVKSVSDEDEKQQQFKNWEEKIKHQDRGQIWQDIQKDEEEVLSGITKILAGRYLNRFPALLPAALEHTWRAPDDMRKHLPDERTAEFMTAKQAGNLARYFQTQWLQLKKSVSISELNSDDSPRAASEELSSLKEKMKDREVELADMVMNLRRQISRLQDVEQENESLRTRVNRQADESQIVEDVHRLAQQDDREALAAAQQEAGEAQDQLRAIQHNLDVQGLGGITTGLKDYVAKVSQYEMAMNDMKTEQESLQEKFGDKCEEVRALEERINSLQDVEEQVLLLKAEKCQLGRTAMRVLSDVALLLTMQPNEIPSSFLLTKGKRMLDRISEISKATTIHSVSSTEEEIFRITDMQSYLPYEAPESNITFTTVTVFADTYYSGQTSEPFDLQKVVRYGLAGPNNNLNPEEVQSHLVWIEQVVLKAVCRTFSEVTAETLALPFLHHHLRTLLKDVLLNAEPEVIEETTEDGDATLGERMDLDNSSPRVKARLGEWGAMWRYLGAHILLLMARLHQYYKWSEEAQAEFASFLNSQLAVLGTPLLAIARVRGLLAIGHDEDADAICRSHASLKNTNLEQLRYMTNMIYMIRLLFDTTAVGGAKFIEGKLGDDKVSVLRDVYGEYVFVQSPGSSTYTLSRPHNKCGFEVGKTDKDTVSLRYGSGHGAVNFKVDRPWLDTNAPPKDQLAAYILSNRKKQLLRSRDDLVAEVIAESNRGVKKAKQDFADMLAMLGK